MESNEVESEEIDYAAGIPPQPNSIRDKAHLEELLLVGMNSGPATPLTASDFDEIKQHFRERQSIVADEEYWAEKRKQLIERLTRER